MRTMNNPPYQTQKKRRAPLGLILALDVVLIGVSLCVFALFHHVLPSVRTSENITISYDDTTTSTTTTTAALNNTSDASLTTVSTGVSTSSWTEKFADKFTDTVVSTDTSYTSPNVSITMEQKTTGSGSSLVTYYVADVYIADVDCFQSYLAEDTYGSGFRESVLDMDLASNALLAMTGDYYGNQEGGIVIRNGEVYCTDASDSDVCVLYHDGTLVTYTADEFDIDEAIADGAWQAWTFGPALLDDGNALASFDLSRQILGVNPRSGIGYYEPGHYCFVVVDGRDDGYSVGVTMEQFAQIFEDLGCTTAYNLDGGKSAVMTYDDAVVNQPDSGGRTISDCILIGEVA
ncbi:MAG: phosphodiester glycosidase family protein [Actinobacteria bacterium]|nr:phosphodiester glycosidase family protein [Actinomycetota bacterium]